MNDASEINFRLELICRERTDTLRKRIQYYSSQVSQATLYMMGYRPCAVPTIYKTFHDLSEVKKYCSPDELLELMGSRSTRESEMLLKNIRDDYVTKYHITTSGMLEEDVQNITQTLYGSVTRP